MQILKTALNDFHARMGAKLVDFAGWNMPLSYTSIIEEHNATRNNCTMFDVSHMGRVYVSRPTSIRFGPSS